MPRLEDVSQHVVKDAPLTREMIDKQIEADLLSSIATLQVVLSEPSIRKAVVDVFWKRYQVELKKMEIMPEINYKPEIVPNGLE